MTDIIHVRLKRDADIEAISQIRDAIRTKGRNGAGRLILTIQIDRNEVDIDIGLKRVATTQDFSAYLSSLPCVERVTLESAGADAA